MILDAPSFKTLVTPEVALSIVQKEVARRRWPMELSEIRLVYVPYWVFSFDVLAEGPTPSGRAALNAASGELDEFVPQILSRPFKKTKETEEDAEVEPTNVSRSEAEKVAPAKVAATAGIKRDSVAVSALAKYYLPTYYVWVNIPGLGEFKIELDALTGSPNGLEQIPAKEKGWNESASEALDKMKTPKGWADLAGEAASTAGQGKGPSLLSNKYLVWAGLIVLILVILFLFNRQGSAAVNCTVGNAYLGAPEYFGLFGDPYLRPAKTLSGQLIVRGSCEYTNKNSNDVTACVRLDVLRDSATIGTNTSCLNVPAGTEVPREKEFEVAFNGSSSVRYRFRSEQTV